MLIDLAVNGLFDPGKHLLPLALYHTLYPFLLFGEVLQMFCDEPVCCLLLVPIIHHRFRFMIPMVQSYDD